MDLQQWLSTLTHELGLDDVTLDDEVVRTLLDLARDCAHEIERVAAPLSTYLVGVAVGRGAQVEYASGRATALLPGSGPADPG